MAPNQPPMQGLHGDKGDGDVPPALLCDPVSERCCHPIPLSPACNRPYETVHFPAPPSAGKAPASEALAASAIDLKASSTPEPDLADAKAVPAALCNDASVRANSRAPANISASAFSPRINSAAPRDRAGLALETHVEALSYVLRLVASKHTTTTWALQSAASEGDGVVAKSEMLKEMASPAASEPILMA